MLRKTFGWGGSETYKDWERSAMRVTGGGGVTRRVRIGNVQNYVDTLDWRGFSSGGSVWGFPKLIWKSRGSIRGFSLGVPQN